ncbi:unnamed protein product, partial [Anisakis simplex]|uniref:Uncharacterized protein n=1 Tax=Anisakis simplex TaxID=6269 RepID=A0A0M3JN93_ANISI
MNIKPVQGKQPPLIAICISSENWLASCYARYGSKQCVEWSLKCKSKYLRVGGDVTVQEKECVMS